MPVAATAGVQQQFNVKLLMENVHKTTVNKQASAVFFFSKNISTVPDDYEKVL